MKRYKVISCIECGESFVKEYSHQYTCSNRCRFLQLVTETSRGCWVKNHIHKRTVPCFRMRYENGQRKEITVRRAAWVLFKKAPLKDIFRVLATCNNRDCCNPDHLMIKDPAHMIAQCKKCTVVQTPSNSQIFKNGSFRRFCYQCQNKVTHKIQYTDCIQCGVSLNKDTHIGYQRKLYFCSLECNFKHKCIIDKATSCWIWNGSFKNGEYMFFNISKGYMKEAKSCSLFLFKNIPLQKLRHKIIEPCACNKKCVNPNHINQGPKCIKT